jgi:hypothetical protein
MIYKGIKLISIKKISIHEKRHIDTKELQSRTIFVKFGDVCTWKELNETLGKRKLDQLSDSEYQFGIYFKIRSRSDSVTLLSTLHEISPFTSEMKTAIVNYFEPNMEESKKLILKKDLFFKFTKIPSLFNLALDEVNEETCSKNVGFDLKPKISI